MRTPSSHSSRPSTASRPRADSSSSSSHRTRVSSKSPPNPKSLSPPDRDRHGPMSMAVDEHHSPPPPPSSTMNRMMPREYERIPPMNVPHDGRPPSVEMGMVGHGRSPMPMPPPGIGESNVFSFLPLVPCHTHPLPPCLVPTIRARKDLCTMHLYSPQSYFQFHPSPSPFFLSTGKSQFANQ